ncbi:hypothetical protein [Oleiharenicola lentus]|uniref:hypothetical protein n=1 Tax=Oleiharenicola lentus TaxID=2508720 RepID=UPI003F67ED95
MALNLNSGVEYLPPIGSMTFTAPKGQTTSIALPLLNYVSGSGAIHGAVTAAGSNYIDVTGAGWTAGAFSNASSPYYLRITSGTAAGRVMTVSTTPNTASRLFVNNDGIDLSTGAGIVSGDTYELVPADTLSSLFGTTLMGGADAATADNIQVWSGASWQPFYYNTTRNRWERSGTPSLSANNVILRPDRGFFLARRSYDSDFILRVGGRVPQIAPRYFHARMGVTFLSLGVPVGQTLAQLGLETRAPGWVTGTSVPGADYIQVWGGASWHTFYFDSTNLRWQRNGFPSISADNFNLHNRPVMINRSGSASAADSTILLPIPYPN